MEGGWSKALPPTKEGRLVATRYDKLAANDLAFIQLSHQYGRGNG